MKFNLNYTPPKADFQITHDQRILLLGSCFSENIGNKLRDLRFDCLSNSCGILYNPLSIHLTLQNWIQENETYPRYILERGGEFFCYLHHSSVKAGSGEELCELIAEINARSLDYLKHADILIITFGSAWYYWHKSLNTAVANCHKQPAACFEKKLWKVDEMVSAYDDLISQLQSLNPKLRILLTVSPVKYLRDGIVENNISKASLLLGAHEIIRRHSDRCHYFPAYELITDDLRDYRFYGEDLAHPTAQAISYVWEKFSSTYFSEATLKLNELLSKLNTATLHRPLHHNEAENKKLQQHLEQLRAEIKKLNPRISF